MPKDVMMKRRKEVEDCDENDERSEKKKETCISDKASVHEIKMMPNVWQLIDSGWKAPSEILVTLIRQHKSAIDRK